MFRRRGQPGARRLRSHPSDKKVERSTKVGEWSRENRPRLRPDLRRDNGLAANSLHHPLAQALVRVLLDSIEIGHNQLKLEAGASWVEHENIHDRLSFFPSDKDPLGCG